VTGIFIMTFYSITILSEVNDDSYDNDNYYSHNNKGHNSHKTYGKNMRHHGKKHEYDAEEQIQLMVMSWMFMLVAMVFWSIIFSCFKRSSFKRARKGVEQVVDRYSALFASTGLRWNLPLAFPHYIELWKDYKGQNYAQNQTQIQPNNQFSCNPNPLSYNQIHNQLQVQNQNQNQRYPSLNHVVDQRAGLDFQNNGASYPLLDNHAPRRDANTYIPPYPIQFASNAQ